MNSPEPRFFATALITWYNQHKRPLPWRDTQNPYAIWLSEIILQQTRVNQGLPYYQTFISNYPTINDLANAPEDEVLRHWQGLGYYSRARNMHHTAKYIAYELGGSFPNTYAGLVKLKGIGPYTAAAIASFAFKEPVAVLDGNVFRVLARVYGLADDIASPAGKKAFQLLADSLISPTEPDTYNQAIMEFGAIQCTPVTPDCLFCPLQQTCFAFLNGLVQVLPHKSKAKAGRERYFHYLVLQWQNQYYLRKRTQSDIWQGLYDFYLHETDTPDLPQALLNQELQLLVPNAPVPAVKAISENYKHVLTHQKIYTKFYLIRLHSRLSDEIAESTGLSLFPVPEIEQLPKAIMIDRYLKAAVF
jgi:A/G-specific adenine glycosylase